MSLNIGTLFCYVITKVEPYKIFAPDVYPSTPNARKTKSKRVAGIR